MSSGGVSARFRGREVELGGVDGGDVCWNFRAVGVSVCVLRVGRRHDRSDFAGNALVDDTGLTVPKSPFPAPGWAT
jgi:hypothetical protein